MSQYLGCYLYAVAYDILMVFLVIFFGFFVCFFSNCFSGKQRLGISCELSALDDSYEMSSLFVYEKYPQK